MGEKEEEVEEVQKEAHSEPDTVPWATFLETYPLDTLQNVSNYHKKHGNNSYHPFLRLAPVLRLYCTHCDGIRNFSGKWQHEPYFADSTPARDFLVYTCKDCEEGVRTFCLISQATDEAGNGCAIKIGELPALYLEIPPSLKRLLEENYTLFTKGLACERRGLGIGAFTYYRRVVESQKDRLIDEIRKVSEKLMATSEFLSELDKMKSEKRFASAVDGVKKGMPDSLLVDGHNPLKLLHDALSIGVHSQTDDECLKIAHTIRLVLVDLSARIRNSLNEHKELREAVSDLIKSNANSRKPA